MPGARSRNPAAPFAEGLRLLVRGDSDLHCAAADGHPLLEANCSALWRRHDDTRRTRPPGHGLDAEIAQLEPGKLPKISVPAWPQQVTARTARLTHHPLSNREFLEVSYREYCSDRG